MRLVVGQHDTRYEITGQKSGTVHISVAIEFCYCNNPLLALSFCDVTYHSGFWLHQGGKIVAN